MTGAYSILGILQENSIRVELDRINQAGGVGGAKLELVVRDSALDPGKAVQAVNELVGDSQVKMVVGPSLSAFYNASKDIYEQNRLLNCQPGVGTGDFSVLKYGFRSQEPNEVGVERLVHYLQSQNVTSLGLVYEADDTGKATDAYLKEFSPKYGITYLGYQQTRPDDQSHRPYLDKLKDAGAIVVSSNAGGAKTMAAADEAGYKGLLTGTSGLQNVSFLDAAGDLAIGSIFVAGNLQFNIRDRATWKPGYRAHVEEVEKRFGLVEGPKSGAKMPKGTAIAADCVKASRRRRTARSRSSPRSWRRRWRSSTFPTPRPRPATGSSRRTTSSTTSRHPHLPLGQGRGRLVHHRRHPQVLTKPVVFRPKGSPDDLHHRSQADRASRRGAAAHRLCGKGRTRRRHTGRLR